jgi:hypothetical protein
MYGKKKPQIVQDMRGECSEKYYDRQKKNTVRTEYILLLNRQIDISKYGKEFNYVNHKGIYRSSLRY